MRPECPDDPALPVAKRKCINSLPEIRSDLTEEKFIDDLKETSAKGTTSQTLNYAFYSDPFSVYVLKNFLDDEEFLLRMKEEFNEVVWRMRWLDLYEFFQSEDLRRTKLRHLSLFYNYLKDTVMPYVRIFLLKLKRIPFRFFLD